MPRPTETFLLGILLHRLVWRLMSLQTRWQQGHVQEVAGATALEVSRVVVDVLLSITVCRRQPSSRCSRPMLYQSLLMARMGTVHPVLVQVRPRRMRFRHVKIAVPPSHRSGEGTMLAKSSVMHVVRTQGGCICCGLSLTVLARPLLQASRHPPPCRYEEARDQAPKTGSSCR